MKRFVNFISVFAVVTAVTFFIIGRGLHSFTLELNLSNSRTNNWVKLGYTVHRRAQVELKSERV